MAKYEVEALEKFVVRTTYCNVEARSKKEAERRCRDGLESYEHKEVEEGGEEWIKTVSVTKVEG